MKNGQKKFTTTKNNLFVFNVPFIHINTFNYFVLFRMIFRFCQIREKRNTKLANSPKTKYNVCLPLQCMLDVYVCVGGCAFVIRYCFSIIYHEYFLILHFKFCVENSIQIMSKKSVD